MQCNVRGRTRIAKIYIHLTTITLDIYVVRIKILIITLNVLIINTTVLIENFVCDMFQSVLIPSSCNLK